MKQKNFSFRSMILLIFVIIGTAGIAGPSLCNQYGSQSPNVIVTNGATSSSLSTNNFTNMKILFLGDFIIDNDITFNNCRLEFVNGYVRFSPSSSNLQLSLHNSKVYSCYGEWSIQTYNSPNNHRVYVGNCHFQNFTQAFRLRGTIVGISFSTFDGGVDYTHGTVDLHNCTHTSDASIYNNTFNQVEGGTAIHSSEGSQLLIWYNRFNGGGEGVHSENSDMLLTDNVFSQVGTGINSSHSNLIVNKFYNQNFINFDHCGRGILSNYDVLDVSNQVFKSAIDSDISNATFARFTDNDFLDPTGLIKQKTNIRARATNLLLNNNDFINNYTYSLGVDANGGFFRAVGNTQSRGVSTPYNAYNIVNTPAVFNNNIMYNGSALFSSIANGSYSANSITNNLNRDAWTTQMSPAGLYCDNNITSPSTRGMFFDGNNANTTLATTTFGNCRTGIEINEVLGKQDKRGNKWIGTYTNVGAAYTGNILNMDNSRFTARNFLPWTPSRNPLDLFFPTTLTTINDCSSGIINDGGLTETDLKIIDGTFVWHKSVDEWISKWYLYYKIYKNPSYLSNVQAATWYQNMTGTDVSNIAMIHHHMHEAYQYSNESTLTSIIGDISNVDPLNAVNLLTSYWTSLKQESLVQNTHKNYHLNQVLTYVQSLNRSTSFDGLVKDVYLPYIHTLLDTSYVLSAGEQSTINYAAQLCPQEYGFAVHAARHFVATDDLYDLYEINCIDTDVRSHKEKQDLAPDFTVSPNPSGGKMQVFGEVTGKLSLYNHLGQLIDEFDVIDGIIDISNQPAGIYFIGNKQQMKKIILIK